MQSKVILVRCVMLLSFMPTAFAVAQQEESIEGYWKQQGESVYIKVDNKDGRMNAEVVRSDWAPGLVGTILFSDVVAVEGRKDRWAGETPNPNSSRAGKATLRVYRSGALSIRLKPGGRSMWTRSEAVEKRY